MTIDDLPAQFEDFISRARAALDQEITKARKAVDNLNLEKTAAANALAELQAQQAQAKDQLKLTRSELQHSAALAGVGHDIEKARSELQRLKAETEREAKALDKLAKQRTEAEHQLVALNNEAQRMIAIRVEGEAAMADIRSKLAQVQIGRSA